MNTDVESQGASIPGISRSLSCGSSLAGNNSEDDEEDLIIPIRRSQLLRFAPPKLSIQMTPYPKSTPTSCTNSPGRRLVLISSSIPQPSPLHQVVFSLPASPTNRSPEEEEMVVDTDESSAAAALWAANFVVLKLRDYEIDSDLLVLVCKGCKVAVPPKCALTHLRTDKIQLTKEHVSDLKNHIPSLNLVSGSAEIPSWEAYLALINYIGHTSSVRCGICGYCCPKMSTMDWHWSMHHKDIDGCAVKETSICDIQNFFPLWPKYFPVVPILTGLGPTDKYHLYLKQFSVEVAATDKVFPPAWSDLEVPPLLCVTLWHEHLAKFTINKLHVQNVQLLVDTAAANNKTPRLGKILSKTVSGYMQAIKKQISQTPIPALMLLMNYPRQVLSRFGCIFLKFLILEIQRRMSTIIDWVKRAAMVYMPTLSINMPCQFSSCSKNHPLPPPMPLVSLMSIVRMQKSWSLYSGLGQRSCLFLPFIPSSSHFFTLILRFSPMANTTSGLSQSRAF